jgi:2-dehydropantoate 2-reductase
MRIAIFGVGAMGCLFGARLTAHADVILIGQWPEQIAALRQAPLRFITPGSTPDHEQHIRLRVTDDPDSVESVDVALILTKAPKTDHVAQIAARLLAPDGMVLTLQNGIGNLESLAQYVGADRAALGVTTLGANIAEPGVLRFGGSGITHLATRPTIDAQIRELAALFQRAGLETHVVADVSGLVWGKLAINAGINPLTALLRVPNGALTRSEWARGIMRAAADEVAAVAVAQGIDLPFESAADRAEEVARLTAQNRSSMLQDATRGAPTEIDTICGAVVRIAESMGVETPVNRMLYELIKALEDTHGLNQ